MAHKQRPSTPKALSKQVAALLLEAELPWPEDIFGGFDKWSELDDFLKTLGYRNDNVGAELMRRGWKVRQRQLQEAVNDLAEWDEKAISDLLESAQDSPQGNNEGGK